MGILSSKGRSATTDEEFLEYFVFMVMIFLENREREAAKVRRKEAL